MISEAAYGEGTLLAFPNGDTYWLPNKMAPGYQSYAWTTQDWRVVQVKSGDKVDYKDKCGAPSNRTKSGKVRLCLPAPVIKKLLRSAEGKRVLIKQARKKERAKKGARVTWDPLIKKHFRELEQRTVKDRPKR